MNKRRIGALVAAAALTLTFAGTAFAGNLEWNGKNGWPVADGCNQDDTPPGSMLWIYTGDSDSAVVLTMNGDEYTGVQMGKGSWHIITPYTETKPDASIAFTGEYKAGVLTISHGCAGETTTSTTSSEESSTTSSETSDTSSTTTSDESSTTTSDESSTTTSDESSSTTTSDESSSTTSSETSDTSSTTSSETTPAGSVEELTPPSTDTAATNTSSPVSTSLPLILAGVLATAMVVVPAAARSRR